VFTNIAFHDTLQEALDIVKDNSILFIAQDSQYDHNMIKNSNKKIYGAIFPQIIYKNKHYSKGIVSFMIDDLIDISIHHLKSDNSIDISSKSNSIITIIDGLSSNISIFLEELFNNISKETTIIGGGAGKLTLQQEPVIFDSTATYQDSALLISSTKDITIGISHGWQILSEPLIATDTDKNILKQINFKNAYDVYKYIVEKDSKKSFSDNDFFDIAKSYPLGISKIDNQVLVRDPISTNQKELILVGDIDKNSVINILKGDKTNLINSAKEATNKANSNSSTTFVVDCISRLLFLEDDFSKELEEIIKNSNNSTLFGILSLGEIANNNQDYIEFYNKTCVVGR
jgi:hypothetical protein